MTERKTLYAFADASIKIDIAAYFTEEDLVIEGYDIGPRVKEAWGDSDYEYQIRVKAENLPQLYDLLKITQDEKKALLEELAIRYHTNTCFSDISNLLSIHNIPAEAFSWT